MPARLLYFVTDCDSPQFPRAFLNDYYPLVLVQSDFASTDWINWDASGCMVIEMRDPFAAVALLERIRLQWISLPAIMQLPTTGGPPPPIQRFGFSAVIRPGHHPLRLVLLIEALLKQDQAGRPSPWELRQRLGRLTGQERRVLEMSLRGDSSREIADRLNIRYQTVDKYRRNALVRMKAVNLVDLLHQLYLSLGQRLVVPLGQAVEPGRPEEPIVSLADSPSSLSMENQAAG